MISKEEFYKECKEIAGIIPPKEYYDEW